LPSRASERVTSSTCGNALPTASLNVRYQVGQAVVRRAELLEIQARMAVSEPGGRLSQADVADGDAATDSLSGLKALRHLDEPAAIQSGGVLEKDEGTIRPLAKAGIQLAHSGEQAIRLCRHLKLVMHDQSGDAACEAVGEFPHHGAVPPVQHVDATAQVDDRQARMGGHELQDIFEVVRRVRVHLGGHSHLGEAETSEFEQRIVAINALLEQGMNVPEYVLLRVRSLGVGLAEAARVFGVHHNAVNRWIQRYREGGWAGLSEQRRGRRPGDQAALSELQQREVIALVRQSTPDQLGLAGFSGPAMPWLS
jgi:transposase